MQKENIIVLDTEGNVITAYKGVKDVMNAIARAADGMPIRNITRVAPTSTATTLITVRTPPSI